jgi:hypothetical protein
MAKRRPNPITEAIERVRKIYDDEKWDFMVREHASSLLVELEGAAKSFTELESYARKSRMGRHSNAAARKADQLEDIRRFKLIEKICLQEQVSVAKACEKVSKLSPRTGYETLRKSHKRARKLLTSPAYRFPPLV